MTPPKPQEQPPFVRLAGCYLAFGRMGYNASIRGDEVGISEDTIKTIVRRILKVYKADRIIMFGSAAADQMTRDSDIDLLVVRKGVKDRLTASVKINEALRGMGYPFDIIVMPLDRFEETKNTIGGLAYPANKYGKVIYAKAA